MVGSEFFIAQNNEVNMPDYGVRDYRDLLNNISATNTTVGNRFNNYDMPFSYSDMSGVLDNLFNQQSGQLTRSAGNAVQRGQKDTASRLASQGITGGSVFNNQINKVTDATNQSFADALEQLGIGRLGQNAGLMQTANQNQFNVTHAAQGVDQQNFINMLQKYGLANSVTGGLSNARMQEDQAPSWLDDLMAGINTGANVAKAFKSDERLKENIKKRMTLRNGVEIIDFNYKNNPGKRYRGVSAQQVEKIMPEAISESGGYKMVNYSKLGIPFMEV